MTHDTAIDIMIESYNFLYCGTSTMQEIEKIMINTLVRKGASKASARKWVMAFLGDD